MQNSQKIDIIYPYYNEIIYKKFSEKNYYLFLKQQDIHYYLPPINDKKNQAYFTYKQEDITTLLIKNALIQKNFYEDLICEKFDYHKITLTMESYDAKILAQLYKAPKTLDTLDDVTDQRTQLTDVTGVMITAHLATPSEEDQAASSIQSWLRQRHRAREIHRRPMLFGPASADTAQNGVRSDSVPSQFQHLLNRNLPEILATTTHSSARLPDILHDGAIYSYSAAHLKGISSLVDLTRSDDRLVFTSPLGDYGHDKITFSIRGLAKRNQRRAVYFKFYDWAFPLTFWVELSPQIGITIKHRFPETVVAFIRKNSKECIAEFGLPGELLVHQGINNLNAYLTFFIFELIDRLPESANAEKKYLFDYFTLLDQRGVLIQHLQSLMKKILKFCELDFVNKVIIDFVSIKKVVYKSKKYNFDELRNKVRADAAGVELTQFLTDDLFKDSYFFVKGLLDYATTHHAVKTIAQITSQMTQVLNRDNETKLLERGTYVYKQHLSKEYSDEENSITINGVTIPRFNHGLPLAFRNAAYTPEVINFYSKLGHTEGFRQYCQQLSPAQLLDIQTAILFSFSGRESEVSFFQNPQLYNQYKSSSVQNYVAFARQNNFSSETINLFAELLQYIGNPNYVIQINPNCEEKHYLYYIMCLARDLDLMRCEGLSKYLNSINTIIEPSTRNCSDRDLELNKLFELVTTSLINTGDQLMCGFSNDRMIPMFRSHTSRFAEASTNPVKCWQMITDNKNYKPVSSVFFKGVNNTSIAQNTALLPNISKCIVS